jgi:hypothetical protein
MKISVKDYLNKDIKIFSEARYLELEKALTQYADKNEAKVDEDGEKRIELNFDIMNLQQITKYRKNCHDTYVFELDTSIKKLAKTMDEFIELKLAKRAQGYQDPVEVTSVVRSGIWFAEYSISMNFISLFIDDMYFNRTTETENFPFIDPNSENSKILKYFLAGLYEHAATPDIDEWQASLDIMQFEINSLVPVFDRFRSGLYFFLSLVVNGFDFYNDSDRSPTQPRYRDRYKLRSFEILWNSLKEYEPESALKLMALITKDFSSLTFFLTNIDYTVKKRKENLS